MAVSACEFSKDGKYFAQISEDGQLNIWNILSKSIEQEFTPDFQLTSPCTCLHFVDSHAAAKGATPRKKKRRESQNELGVQIALGTSAGRLLVYSLTKGDLDYVVESNTSQTINCLSSGDEFMYSGTDSGVLVWNLNKKTISSKWVTGNDKIYAILVVPGTGKLLTAAKSIKLWDVKSKEVLKTYTGHSSQITLLKYVPPKDSKSDDYVISGSKGDRLLNCWNLNEDAEGTNAIATFLMEDVISNISIVIDDGITNMAATVRSGVVHIYQHTLNGGKSNKPIKPKTTIQVVDDYDHEKLVSPIRITASLFRDSQTLCICYGTAVIRTFEDITISTYKKLQCLLRNDLFKGKGANNDRVTKTRTPVVGNDVHYLIPQTSSVISKRKSGGQHEIPMEKRLENLMASDSGGKVPTANNVAQLLVQGLHSKDSNILNTVLYKNDEQLIKNTVQRLPIGAMVPLFEELTKLVQGKTMARQIGLIWLKNLILVHSGILLSNPELPKLFGETLGSIEAGLAMQASRNKLMGRLELLVAQTSQLTRQENQDEEALLIFNDSNVCEENGVMED